MVLTMIHGFESSVRKKVRVRNKPSDKTVNNVILLLVILFPELIPLSREPVRPFLDVSICVTRLVNEPSSLGHLLHGQHLVRRGFH